MFFVNFSFLRIRIFLASEFNFFLDENSPEVGPIKSNHTMASPTEFVVIHSQTLEEPYLDDESKSILEPDNLFPNFTIGTN